MTEKEIIFKPQSHPEWITIKESNPALYQKMTEKFIAERLAELRPLFLHWQFRSKKFLNYENSLPNISTQFDSIDFTRYNKDLENRRDMSKQFFTQCMCYPIDSLIRVCETRPTEEWIIKELINQQAVRYYKTINIIRHNIISITGRSLDEINKVPVWGYFPFYNHIVGLDWLRSKLNKEFMLLAENWAILLCFDQEMFSSDSFIYDLQSIIGKGTFSEMTKHLISIMKTKNVYNRPEFQKSYRNIVSWNESNSNKFQSTISLKSKKVNTHKQHNSPSKKEEIKDIPVLPSAMDDPVIDTKESIVRKVCAKDFVVKCGYISYNKYILMSPKINSEVPTSVLSQISYRFRIKLKVNILKSGKLKNRRFFFDPSDDLFLFLSECERLQEISNFGVSSYFPQSGEFNLPWRYVFFYDRVMYLAHPNPSKHGSIHPFVYRHPSITKSFRDLMVYIESRCTLFKVRAKDGVIVALLNFQSFQNMIPQFRTHSSGTYGGIDEIFYNKLSSSYRSSDFTSLKFVRKSPYLSHLAFLQVSSRKIYRILERVIYAQAGTDHDEFGFLFTVKEYRSYSWIIYENVSDESRSSILFQVRTVDFDQAIEVVRTFFAGHEANKRQRLAQSTIRLKSSAILSYRRIHHTSFSEWKYNLSFIL